MELHLQRVLRVVLATAVAAPAAAQQCYSPQNQCFSFAPPGEEVERVDSGIVLRSESLEITGDIRFRARFASTATDAPYNENDQQTTRTRIQLNYTVNENVTAFAEFNFAEVWAGAEGYSDAQPDPTMNGFASRENFNAIGQAYMQLDDAFDMDLSVRIGRSNYFLANGMVLGSCDFLQYSGAFTGAWIAKSFDVGEEGQVDLEIFGFDNYGPLQSQLPGGGERYYGGTARWTVSEDGPVRSANAYYMAGTNDGDVSRNAGDDWTGVELDGAIADEFDWFAQFAHRQVAGGPDVSASRARIEYNPEGENRTLRQVSYTFTDSEGALHVNPADFNTAGLLHQYGGIWRSDLQTNQLSAAFGLPKGFDGTLSAISLDRRGAAMQLGDFEIDALLGKTFDSGVHFGFGYGIDNDDRQVGYVQFTVYF
tara:strand:- start:17559 stop:18830 length:1272 start_codon:yes stop_codon:yes gene_type:complete